MIVRMYGATDVGRSRKMNQDNFFFDARQGLVVVADGIGGRKAGEVASSLAVSGIRSQFKKLQTLRPEEVATFLSDSVSRANRNILERGQMDPAVEGMGTTINCLLFVGGKVFIAHIGDSRTYLLFGGGIWQLTLDHSIEIYLKRGWLAEESLDSNARPGALVRALGLSSQVDVDLYEKDIKQKEIYLTCSDGLTSMVSDRQILKIVKEHRHCMETVPQMLIDQANLNGGRDNITVVLAEVNKS